MYSRRALREGNAGWILSWVYRHWDGAMVERVSKEIRHEPPCHKYGRRLDDENRAIVTITRKPTETRTNHLRRQARVSSFALCLPLCISTIIVY
jgi:hypothetical protein